MLAIVLAPSAWADPQGVDHFTWTVSGPVTAGTPVSVTIQAVKKNGDVVPSYTGTAELTVDAGTISPSATGGFVQGVVTLDVTVTQGGPGRVLTATDDTTPGHVITGSTGALAVSGGALDHLVLAPLAATNAAGSSQTYTARGQDASNNDLGDVTASTTFAIEGGSCVAASCSATAIGDHTVTATHDGKTGTAMLTITAGPLDHVVLSPESAFIGAGGTAVFTVEAFDAFGNGLGDVTAETVFAITGSGACAANECGATQTGDYTVTATHDGKSDTSLLQVSAGALDHLLLSPATATVPSGQNQVFSAQGVDAFGNSLGDATSFTTFTIDAASGACLLNACAAALVGFYTVTGDADGKTGTAILEVEPGPPAYLLLTPDAASTTAGETQAFTASAYDESGNEIGDVTEHVLFELTPDGACDDDECLATAAGTHVVTGTYAGVEGHASLDVAPGPLDHLHVTLASDAAGAGHSVAAKAEGRDAYENDLGDVTGDATFTIDPSGACEGEFCYGTQAVLHTITASLGDATGSATLFVEPGPVDHLVLGPESQTLSADEGSQVFTVRAEDEFGNLVADVTDDAFLAIEPDGACDGATCSATLAGAHVVTATLDGATGTATLNMVPGDPDQLVFVVLPGAVTSLDGFTVEVEVRDAAGNLATSGEAEVSLALASGPGNLQGTLTRTAVEGRATFDGLTLDVVGPYTLRATADGLESATSGEVEVAAGPLDHIQISPSVSSVLAGQFQSFTVEAFDAAGNALGGLTDQSSFSIGPDGSCVANGCSATGAGVYTVTATHDGIAGTATLSVEPGTAVALLIGEQPHEAVSLEPFSMVVYVVDEYGNGVTTADDEVTLFLGEAPFGGLLGGLRVRYAVDGVARFDDLNLDREGSYTIRATASGLVEDASDPIYLAPSPAARLSFSQLPTNPISGQPFEVAVMVLDEAGNLAHVGAFGVELVLAAGPEGGVLTGTLEATSNEGFAFFPAVILTGVGTYAVEAQAPGLAAAISVDLQVQPVATHLAFSTTPATVGAGEAFELRVQVLDPLGVVVPGATHTIQLSDEGSVLQGLLERAAVDGLAHFSNLRLNTAGVHEVMADATGLASADPLIINVEPGSAAALKVTGPLDVAIAGQPFAVQVYVEDAFSNVVSDEHPRLTVSKGADSASGTLSGTRSGTPVDGVATFEGLMLSSPGIYRLEASTPGLPPARSPFFAVNPTDVERIETIVLNTDSATLEAGETHEFVATAYDADGVVIEGLAFTFELLDNPEVGVLDAEGLFAAVKAGEARVQATAGGTSSNPANVEVTPGPLAQLQVTPPAASVLPDTAVDFTVEGADAFGNARTIGSAVTWSVDGAAVEELDADAVFIFPGQPVAGVHVVTASVETVDEDGVTPVAIHQDAVVHVTAEEALAGTTTTFQASAVQSSVEDVESTTYSVGVAVAEADAVLDIEPPAAADGSSALLEGAQVTLGRAASNLAIVVETRPGDLSVSAGEADVGDLVTQLVSLSTTTEPAILIHVTATEGGEVLDSSLLNELLEEMEVEFLAPAAYFAENGLDPENVRLIEYSAGNLVTASIVPVLVSETPDADGFYHYTALLTEFSTFALVGMPLSTPSVVGGGGGSGGSGGSGANVGAGLGDNDEDAATTVSSSRLPAGAPPVPSGIVVAQVLHVESGSGDYEGPDLIAGITLSEAKVPDPLRAVTMREEGGRWVPVGPLGLARTSRGFEAQVAVPCCGLVAVAFDLVPPLLHVVGPEGQASGIVRVASGAEDNFALSRVDFYVDGVLASSLTAGPWDLTLDSSKHGLGALSVDVVAYDVAGNVASAELSLLVANAPSGAYGRAAPSSSTGVPFAWAPWIFLVALALLSLALLVLVVLRTRRAPRDEVHPSRPAIILTAHVGSGLAERVHSLVWRPLLSARVRVRAVRRFLSDRVWHARRRPLSEQLAYGAPAPSEETGPAPPPR